MPQTKMSTKPDKGIANPLLMSSSKLTECKLKLSSPWHSALGSTGTLLGTSKGQYESPLSLLSSKIAMSPKQSSGVCLNVTSGIQPKAKKESVQPSSTPPTKNVRQDLGSSMRYKTVTSSLTRCNQLENKLLQQGGLGFSRDGSGLSSPSSPGESLTRSSYLSTTPSLSMGKSLLNFNLGENKITPLNNSPLILTENKWLTLRSPKKIGQDLQSLSPKPSEKILKVPFKKVPTNKAPEKTSKVQKTAATGSKKKIQRKEPEEMVEERRDCIEAPWYNIKEEAHEDMGIEMPVFIPPEKDVMLLSRVRPMEDILSKKVALLNAVSSSLICSPNYKNNEDEARGQLLSLAENMAFYDPEFVLKMALYTRKELNIRVTANFLLALAANVRACRPFLKKYFQKSVALPSDWIDVAELYQAFYDKSLNYGSLPAALRRVMAAKFPDFDKYQLAKYNKDKSKKRKPAFKKPHPSAIPHKKEEEPASEDSDEDEILSIVKLFKPEGVDESSDHETEEENVQRTFTLKQLIRKLHITEPVEHVMCLIGKKYPSSLEDFYRTRLPGVWDEERSGKRMKLPVPETWETQVSLKGNKASTWEHLIDNKKLPFMAMLRNLRNMIKAGISPKHHNWVIHKLTDERSVVYSKQFPFRFFSAYEVLLQLESDYEKNQLAIIMEAEIASFGALPTDGHAEPRKMKKVPKGEDGKVQWWLMKKKTKKGMDKSSEVPFDPALLNRYRKALDTSVKIATVYNVQPIKGRTLIFCDVSMGMAQLCTAARGLGKPKELKEVGLLLGLMCKYSCEECELIIYGSNYYTSVQLEKGTILDNLATLSAENPDNDKTNPKLYKGFPKQKLVELLRDRVQVDNLIVLGKGLNAMKTGTDATSEMLSDFMPTYRKIVHSELLFVSIALGQRTGLGSSEGFSHPNDVFISGYSDQILRFIAERGSGAQLTHVENIDKAYNLDVEPPKAVERALISEIGHKAKTDNRKVMETTSWASDVSNTEWTPSMDPIRNVAIGRRPLLGGPVVGLTIPRWRTVRVFISSTFRDMHGERDLLTRFVFPELRARGRKHFLEILEVDLRWGITEEDTKNKKALEMCLREVSKCQMFIGILGERYGWVPQNSDLPDSPEFDWVRDHPQGASVTELEIHAAALVNSAQVQGKALFYIRDNSFMKDVPRWNQLDFAVEDCVCEEKMRALKDRVRNSGLCQIDGYPCSWGGSVDGKPFVRGLEQFGMSVLDSLWSNIVKLYPDEEFAMDEDVRISELHISHFVSQHSKFVGRTMLLKQCHNTIMDTPSGIIMLSGKAGSGKSALMCAVAIDYQTTCSRASDDEVLVHAVGSAPGSTILASTLHRLCWELNQRFLDMDIPEEYKNLVGKFGEMLKEAGKQSRGPVIVFIDGADMMEDKHQPYNMEWIPRPVPQNVIFVLTAEVGGRCYQALQHRGAKEVKVVNLDLMDKPKFVRSTLAIHRKVLDESTFNNQMKLLLSKREANNPLFLNLACEELRVFGVYEQISQKLKSLPQTMSQLLQEVLSRMENDVGTDLIRTSLCLLVSARNGLEEIELHHVLSMHVALEDQEPEVEFLRKETLPAEVLLPKATFIQLLTVLQAFLRPIDAWNSLLSVAHLEMEEAVRQRYLTRSKSPYSQLEVNLHTLLAGYFWQTADPGLDGTWQGTDVRSFSELPHHLACCGSFDLLESVLCDLRFIQKRCAYGQASQLLEDFSPIDKFSWKKQYMKKFSAVKRVQEYKSFVSRHIHLLSRHAGLTIQEALNDTPNSCPSLDAKALLDNSPGVLKGSGVIRWDNKPAGSDPCCLTIADLATAVVCMAVSECEQHMACGHTDGQISLYELRTGKVLRTFSSHSNSVTDVCFVGKSRLTSASHDTTLCVWDVETGQRLSVLKEHQRRVNSCSSNGSLIASASWDCTIKIWNAKDYKRVCEFKDQKPVNCVSFHPEDESIVTGGWDNTLKIWDVFNKKRKAVLRGHSSSVRDAAFSPCGRFIASASLDGEVKLWSALNGSQVGDICGHALPINKLLFSPSGRELITVSDDRKIKVWSGHLGQPLHCMEEEYGPATSVAFSPDGATVAVGYHLGQMRVFDVESGLLSYETSHHSDPVRSITYSVNGETIFTGADDASIKVLSMKSGKLHYSMMGHSKPVLCVTAGFSYLASTSEDFTCCVFQYQTNYQLKTKGSQNVSPVATLNGHMAPVTGCAFNMDETRLATASRDMSVMIWDMTLMDLDLRDQTPLTTLHACHADWITDIKWSNTADFIITSSNDFTLKVWDVGTGKEKTKLVGHTSTINSIAYKYGCVVSGCSDGTAKVWSHKGTEITTLHGHTQRVNHCDIYVKVKQSTVTVEEEPGLSWADQVEKLEEKDKAGKKEKVQPVQMEEVLVVTCSDDGAVRLWKPLQANELACLTGHSGRVVSLSCTKSGSICTSSLDKSIKVWNYELTTENVIGQHNAEVTCVAALPSGEILATSSRNGSVKLWTVHTSNDGTPVYTCACTIQAHQKSVNVVCFLANDRIATASDDATIRFWQIVYNRDPRKVVLKKGTAGLGFNIAGQNGTGLFVSRIIEGGSADLSGELHKGDRLLSVSGVDLRKGSHNEAVAALRAAGDTVEIVAIYDPEAFKKLDQGEDCDSLWIAKNQSVSFRRLPLELRTGTPISSLAFRPGSVLVSGEWSGEIKVWHIDYTNYSKLLACHSSGTVEAHSDWVTGLQFHPRYPTYLFSVGADGMGLWNFNSTIKNVKSRKPENKVFVRTVKSQTNWPSAVGVSEFVCFVGNTAGELMKWNVSPHPNCLPVEANLVCTKTVHAEGITAVLLTEKLVFTASLDHSIKVWSHDYKQLGQFCCPCPVTSLQQCAAFGQDVTRVVCGDELGNVYFLTWSSPIIES